MPRLLRFATVLCGGPDPAEDLLQDVAIKAHRRWANLRELEHPEAYLRRTIVNEYVSWRRKWARMVPSAELRDVISKRDFTDQQADRAELITELGRLPRRQKAVLVLRYFEGLSDPEIADLLGCSASTVRSHASRALAALRIHLHTDVAPRAEEGTHAH